MKAATAKAIPTGEEYLADSTPCPVCAAPLGDPKSSNYLGLGHLEHSWQCHGCGEVFRTTARMAGMVEVEAQAPLPR